MFLESLQNGILPPSLRGALITLLPKLGKVNDKCDNMRPISLLNSNLNILCKILAKRLEPILPGLIMPDQNRFMIGHHGFHNMKWVLNILHNLRGALDTAFLVLDAEKAFDRVGWAYVFEVLGCFGLGEGFCNWVKFCTTIPMQKLLRTIIFQNQ